MKDKIALVAGGLLGLIFIVFGLNFFLKFLPVPPSEEGSPAAMFMGAMFATGYLAVIKVLEILGGVLVAIPKTRNLGLLVLGPIVVNILAYNIFLAPGGWTQPPVLLVTALSAYLLWAGCDKFKQLLN